MSLSVGDVFRVNFIGDCFGQKVMLTHAYRVKATATGVTEESAALALIDAVSQSGADLYQSKYLDVLPPEYTMRRITAQKTGPVRYRMKAQVTTTSGTHPESARTVNQAASIEFYAVLAGRKNQATKRIGPIPEGPTVQVQGKLTSAYTSLLAALGDGMLSDIVNVAPAWTMEPVVINDDAQAASIKLVGHLVGDTVKALRKRDIGKGV